jgi:chorismate mutase
MLSSLLGFVLLLVIVGVALWALQQMPIDASVQRIIRVVVLVVVALVAIVFVADLFDVHVPGLDR